MNIDEEAEMLNGDTYVKKDREQATSEAKNSKYIPISANNYSSLGFRD
jgi:hypothetical protein